MSARDGAEACELDAPGVFLPTVLEENSRFYPTIPAVICGDEVLAWAEFERRTNRVAGLLAASGLAKGDRLVLLMNNSVAMFEALWGAVKAGVVVVPMNLSATDAALLGMINDARPAAIVADDGYRATIDRMHDEIESRPLFFARGAPSSGWASWDDLLESSPDAPDPIAIEGSDTMSLMYSSGTTGVPKGIEHSHFARQLYQFGCATHLRIDHRAVAICTTNLYANGTWMTMMPTVASGGTVVLMAKFDAAEYLRLVAKHRCTHVFMVPTQFKMVLSSPDFSAADLSSLRVMLVAGAPLSRALYDEICVGFPRAELYEMYGMTEGLITVSTPQDPVHGRVGSVGKPIFGGDVRIVAPDGTECPQGTSGEIVAWGGALMKGYYNRPDLTRKILWRAPSGRTYLRTGDLGWIDQDGFIYLSGRIKDMIISGGTNIFPSDIEAVFMQHPQVREAAVVGIPHEKWGETPLAFAILQAGATITADELRLWVNERVGRQQKVHQVELRADFPRAGMGKVRKEELRAPYWKPGAVAT